MDEQIRMLRSRVLAEMDFSREFTDDEVADIITEEARKLFAGCSMSLKEREQVERAVFNALRKLDAIQELVDDKSVTEIMVNGANHIFYEKDGQIYEWETHFGSEEILADVIQRIVGAHNRVVNMSSPIVDSRLEDGSRVNVVLTPISIDGCALTIRKFPEKPMTMEKLLAIGSLSNEAAVFLKKAVQAGYSIMVSGGTGSGKTTFLNALSAYIPTNERVITIEDSAELQLNGIPNIVRMETRNSNQAGVQEISIRDLIRTALRMRPDRIIVGECRGGESFDMLQAMNTGHDGSLTTGHANSCQDMLVRLEMMVRMGMDLPLSAIRSQIASGIDLIVQLGRMSDRSRKVLEIVELDGIKDGEIQLRTLFERQGGEFVQVNELKHDWKLIQNM